MVSREISREGQTPMILSNGLEIFDDHYESLVQGSAIPEELIIARGTFSVEDPDQIMTLGFSKEQAKCGRGVVFPWHSNGNFVMYSYRPDKPRINGEGRPVKYEVPRKTIPILDGLPVPFVLEGIQDPYQPLWITEGCKKSDAAVGQGVLCLALHGTWNWIHRNRYGGSTVIDAFKDRSIAWGDKDTGHRREVIIAFDNDNQKKVGVRLAAVNLGYQIERCGARVKFALLPADTDDKIGLDDYASKGGKIKDIKLVKELPHIPDDRFPRTDLEIAKVLSRELENQLAFDKISSQWYSYKHPVWEVIGDDEVGTNIAQITKDLGGPSLTHAKALAISKFMRVFLGTTFNTALEKLYPFTNGVLDITTGEFREHRPEDHLAWNLGYAYDPSARCPVFDEFIDYITYSDESLQQVLLAFMKATLEGRKAPGRPALKKYLYLVGEPHTGKSQFLNLLRALVGVENSEGTSLDMVAGSNSRFETARFLNKKLVLFEEAGKFLDNPTMLKRMTGGDTLRNEVKGKREITSYTYNGMVAMSSNDNQVTRGTDQGLNERLLIFEFNRLPTEEIKRTLCEESGNYFEGDLIPELPGIFNKVMGIETSKIPYILERRNNPKLNEMWRNHIISSDSIADFCADVLEYDPEGRAQVGSDGVAQDGYMYHTYKAWCVDNGHKPILLKDFAERVVRVFHLEGHDDVRRRKGKPVVIVGVRLNDYKPYQKF